MRDENIQLIKTTAFREGLLRNQLAYVLARCVHLSPRRMAVTIDRETPNSFATSSALSVLDRISIAFASVSLVA